MALLALLAVAVMVFAYVLTSRLNAASRFVGVDRDHNAMVLARAKRALIGWMAINAATDNNPGRLPCPEATNAVGTSSEGIAAPLVTPATPACATPGRLPWRTLGLDKLVDAAAEPLWYAVSPGWALQNSGTLLTINSDSRGAMTVDGQVPPNEVVALIIAPGPAMSVQAAAGCTAKVQTRAAPAPAMDPADYVECFNAATPTFSTTGPAGSFNDQVVRVTTADLIPALEAAIAERMQREIAPALRGVYASAQWGTSATNPLYPFAAPFANPGPSVLSPSNYRGTVDIYQGLLPFTCSATGCASDARYEPTFVSWNTQPANSPTVSISGAISGSGSCIFPNTSRVECTGTYLALGTVTLRMTVRADYVAMALRQLDPSKITIEHGLGSCGSPGPGSAASAVFQSDGSAELTLQGTAPGLLGPPPLLLPLSVNFCMTADLGVLGDHPLLDPTSIGPGSTGWFARNEWFRTTYYAAAQESTADGLPTYGCDSSDCLRYNGSAPRNIRALLVLAGRSLSYPPAVRPNGNLADYLEYRNADLDTRYEQRPMRVSRVAQPAINAPFNDRVILVDWDAANPPVPDPNGPQVVSLAPLRVYTNP